MPPWRSFDCARANPRFPSSQGLIKLHLARASPCSSIDSATLPKFRHLGAGSCSLVSNGTFVKRHSSAPMHGADETGWVRLLSPAPPYCTGMGSASIRLSSTELDGALGVGPGQSGIAEGLRTRRDRFRSSERTPGNLLQVRAGFPRTSPARRVGNARWRFCPSRTSRNRSGAFSLHVRVCAC